MTAPFLHLKHIIMEHIILYAIVPIIVVMLAGYISGKKGIFNGDDSKKFNKVVLDLSLIHI